MRIRSVAAGLGLTAVVVAVPVLVTQAAQADTGTSTSSSCPRSDVRQQLTDYLAAHPDVAQEVAAIRALPADQRADARRQYLADEPDVAQALQGLRADRRDARWEVAGDVAAELADHPAVADLLHQLATVPAGQRADAARQYLADHPDARSELADVRHDVREHRQQCRSGD